MPSTTDAASRWTLCLSYDPQSAGQARAFVRRLAQDMGYAPPDVDDIALATGEAVANALEHGFSGDCAWGENPVAVTVVCQAGWFSVHIRDHGPGFDPEKVRFARQPSLLAERGRGLALMEMLMDRVDHSRLPDGMEVILDKRLPDTNPMSLLETAA